MYLEEIIWLEQFVDKIESKHGIETVEVEEVLCLKPKERKFYARKRDVDPLLDEFSSYEEAADVWDSHDTTDYPDAFAKEPVEIRAAFRQRHFEVEVDEDLFGTLRQRARKTGISVRRLVGELLRQQLAASP